MLLSINDISFGYEDKIILSHVTATLNEGNRVGFIGYNGTGKTTLLNLIVGELIPDDGTIAKKGGMTIGYLRQNAEVESGRNVYEEMQSVFADVIRAESRMRDIEIAIAELSDHNSLEYRNLAAEHTRLQNLYNARDGYNMDVHIKTVLNGMGFSDCYNQAISSLSGGERTRLALCKLLLESPDLMILDEPTNHLDMTALLWLEKYLDNYKGGLIVVSHDRYFMDKVVNRIWELERLAINEYRGNFTKYKELKALEIKSGLRAYERQQEQIAAMEEYARRNIARDSTSNSAKSRLHQLANMERLERPITYVKPPVFSFSIDEESVEEVLTVKDLPVEIADLVLAKSVDFTIMRGKKVALIGDNGCGKTTLLRTLLGLTEDETQDEYGNLTGLKSSTAIGQIASIRHTNPHIRYGKNVSISYYDQENLNMNSSNTVLDELWFRFPLLSQTVARNTLARTLFTAEDIDKRVGDLSGGERAKLGFAIIMQEHGNFIIMDEPTNHLDLASREALESGLRSYGGTLLFVSHDRYFINAVADSVMEMREGKLTVYSGNYDSYLAQKTAAQKMEEAAAAQAQVVSEPRKSDGYKTREMRRREVELKQAVKAVEGEIAKAEADKARYIELLSNSKEYMRYGEYHAECVRLDALIEELTDKWATLAEQLEEHG